MRLTREELKDFPLQPGLVYGDYFEVHDVEDGRRLIIQIDSMQELPLEYLRYGAHIYRFEELRSVAVDYDMPGLELCYVTTCGRGN